MLLFVAFERFQSRLPPRRSPQFMTAPTLTHERLCGSCANSLKLYSFCLVAMPCFVLPSFCSFFFRRRGSFDFFQFPDLSCIEGIGGNLSSDYAPHFKNIWAIIDCSNPKQRHYIYYTMHYSIPCTILYHALFYTMHFPIPCTILYHALF